MAIIMFLEYQRLTLANFEIKRLIINMSLGQFSCKQIFNFHKQTKMWISLSSTIILHFDHDYQITTYSILTILLIDTYPNYDLVNARVAFQHLPWQTFSIEHLDF